MYGIPIRLPLRLGLGPSAGATNYRPFVFKLFRFRVFQTFDKYHTKLR